MIIDYPDLDGLRTKYRNNIIVFCSGSYDLPHLGHIFFFNQAKKEGDLLFVTVGKDAEIQKNKGAGRPILNERIRLETIDAFKPVDYSFLTHCTAQGEHWLAPLREIFSLLRPDVYVVNSDGGDLDIRRSMTEEFGIEMVVVGEFLKSTGYAENLSTTNIIKKIRSLP